MLLYHTVKRIAFQILFDPFAFDVIQEFVVTYYFEIFVEHGKLVQDLLEDFNVVFQDRDVSFGDTVALYPYFSQNIIMINHLTSLKEVSGA